MVSFSEIFQLKCTSHLLMRATCSAPLIPDVFSFEAPESKICHISYVADGIIIQIRSAGTCLRTAITDVDVV